MTQPANTWSNLAYLAVGAALLARGPARPGDRALGAIAVLVALGSAWFHASSTFAGEVADIGAMFLFSAYWLVHTLDRALAWRPTTGRAVFVALVAGSVLALVIFRAIGIALFALQITAVFLVEIAWRRGLRRRGGGAPPLRWLAAVALTFSVAYAIWRLDFHRLLCDRDLHWLQGHAAWHVLNSLCFLFLARYLEEVAPREAGSRGTEFASP